MCVYAAAGHIDIDSDIVDLNILGAVIQQCQDSIAAGIQILYLQ